MVHLQRLLMLQAGGARVAVGSQGGTRGSCQGPTRLQTDRGTRSADNLQQWLQVEKALALTSSSASMRSWMACLAPTAATATCRCEQGRRQACQQQEQEQRRGHVDVLRNAGIVLRRANPQLLLQLAPRACTQAEAAHGTASATHSTRALTPWPPSEHMTASRAVPQKPSSCCSCSACCSIPCPCSCLCCTIS